MRISRYFTDLMATYIAEVDDLKTDSGGSDVLNARLKDKRSQLFDLMPMIKTNPEMVAVIFHKSISINNAKTLLSYLDKEPVQFPTWASVSSSVTFQPWAAEYVATLENSEGGEEFLLTAVMLEYLLGRYDVSEEHANDRDDEASDDDDEDSPDLSEAGGEWMTEQGFDSHQ